MNSSVHHSSRSRRANCPTSAAPRHLNIPMATARAMAPKTLPCARSTPKTERTRRRRARCATTFSFEYPADAHAHAAAVAAPAPAPGPGASAAA
eukprot:3194989-Lingulodinium_polyedra.AAC.1